MRHHWFVGIYTKCGIPQDHHHTAMDDCRGAPAPENPVQVRWQSSPPHRKGQSIAGYQIGGHLCTKNPWSHPKHQEHTAYVARYSGHHWLQRYATCLWEWCFALKHTKQFLCMIWDTDQHTRREDHPNFPWPSTVSICSSCQVKILSKVNPPALMTTGPLHSDLSSWSASCGYSQNTLRIVFPPHSVHSSTPTSLPAKQWTAYPLLLMIHLYKKDNYARIFL